MSAPVDQLELQERTPPEPLPKSQAPETQSPSRSGPRWYAVLLVVWVIGSIYAGSHLMRGWVPHDEGSFAQSADRILHGQMPHRDYTEIYTGGLAYLHAFAFKYLGENLPTLRIVLFFFFFAWVPVFYWVASRFVKDWIAGALTLLAIAWTLPNYSAAVPSWYNLFFATFGLAAILMYLENRSALWLYIAGAFGGLSFLAKSAAIFYVAAVFLFFLFYEQGLSRSAARPEKGRDRLYTVFVVLLMITLPAALAVFIRPHGSPERSVDFVLPSAVLAIILLMRESRGSMRRSSERLAELLTMCYRFAIGLLLPVAVFLIPYARAGALGAFVKGVFIVPFKRVSSAGAAPPDLVTILPCLFLVALIGLAAWMRGAVRWISALVAALLSAYCLLTSAHNMASYRAVWHSAYWLIPVLTAAGGFILWSRARQGALTADSPQEQRLFLLLALCATFGLIQYPFSAPIYFCYAAPLVILAALAVLAFVPSVPKTLMAVVFLCFLLFAVLRVTPPFIYAMGFYYQDDPETQPLNLPRAGNLKVDFPSAVIYEHLIPLVKEHARAGTIYAGPDCPEVYFLSGLANPTRAMFDFFEDDYEEGDYQGVLRLVDGQHPKVVVINTAPAFSEPYPAGIFGELMNRYPSRENIGQFVVFWSD